MFGASVRIVAAVIVIAVGTIVTAVEPPAVDAAVEPEALRAAERDLEIAQIRLRRYENVEFPLAVRKLDSRIRLHEAEAPVWERRIKEYEKLDRFVASNGMLVTLDDARLTLAQVRSELDDARHEKRVLQDDYRDQRRLLELEVEAACYRLAQLRRPDAKAVGASRRTRLDVGQPRGATGRVSRAG